MNSDRVRKGLTIGRVVQSHVGLSLSIIGAARHCDGIKTTCDGWKYVLMCRSINFEGAMTDENDLTAN